jgi:hypothetical protein
MNDKNANYGFDAPSIMVGMLIASAICESMAIFLPNELFGFSLTVFHYLLAIIGLPLFVLGSMMLIYGLFTKRRIRDFILNQVQWRGN